MKNLLTHYQFINESENDEEYPKPFIELSKEEQEMAIEKNDHNLVEDDWYEFVIADFEDILKEFGVEDVEVSFTGFHSQGDGASFTSKSIESEKFMKKALAIESSSILDMGEDSREDELASLVNDLNDLGFKYDRMTPDDFYFEFSRNSSRYSHPNTVTTNLEVESFPDNWGKEEEEAADLLLEEIEKKADEWRVEKSNEIYKRLHDEYDDLTSEETIKQHLIDNDYVFDETGNIRG